MRPAILFVMLTSLALTACTHPGAPPVGVSITFTQLFSGHFSAPPRVTDLKGMPVYSTAVEVSPDGGLATDGGSSHIIVYALINQQDPVQGILVASHDPMSLSFLKEKPGDPTIVGGSLSPFKRKDLVGYFEQKHGIHLSRDADGLPLWIDNDLPAVPASRGPNKPASAPASPAPRPRRQPTQRQNEENAPYDRELVLLPTGLQ